MANAFTFGVGFKADTKSLTESIKAFSGDLTNNPLNLKSVLPDLNTAAAQKALEVIKQQATGIDNVTIKTRTLATASGKTFTFITGMTTKWKDALGAVHTTYNALDKTLKNLDKNITSFDAMGKKATEWSDRAEKMEKKEKDAIQGTSLALREKIAEFKKLAEQGKFAAANKLVPEIKNLNNEFNASVDAAKRSAEGVKSWGARLGDAFKQTVAYAASLGLLRQAQRLLNDGIRYAIDLNKEMINIQVLQAKGAQTSAEINSLANSFNSLAKEMGSTTLEIAKGSVEWLRQGKTIEETATLLRATTTLSKLGNLSAAESTEYLTSTLNSYKLEAKDAIGVVDKLIAVDNASATSAGELATALRYSAAAADQAGVSLNQLISYIGVISSVTRQNAEMIGQAMKTMLTRMQDIKAGAIDEDGLGINNVALALERVDITLMESETEFRDMGAVLEELAGKWSTLNEVEQANIAKSIAGVRQANMFNVLMGNMNDALRLQDLEFRATGLATERYQIYLKGVEAAQNKLTSSLQALWQQGIKNGLIVHILNAITKIIDFITSIGGLKAAVIALGIAFVLLKFPALITYLSALVFAFQGFTGSAVAAAQAVTYFGTSAAAATAVATAGISLVIAALAAIAYGIFWLTQEVQRNKKAWEELAQTAKDSSIVYGTLKENRDTIKSLWEEMDVLRAKTSLTTEETKRLADIMNQLNQLSGGTIVGFYDDELNFSVAENALLQTTLDLLKEELDLKKKISLEDAMAAAIAGEKVVADNAAKVADLRRTIDLGITRTGMGEFRPSTATEIEDARKELNEILLLQKQHALDVIAVYAQLATWEDKLAFQRLITDEDTIAALNKYMIAENKAARAKDEANRNKEAIDAWRIAQGLPPLIDYDALLTGADTLGKHLDDLFAIKKRLADSKGLLSAEDKSSLEAMGILPEKIGNAWVITEAAITAGILQMKKEIKYDKMAAEGQSYIDNLLLIRATAEVTVDELKNLGDAIKNVNSAMGEENKNGSITAETAYQLMQTYPQLADAIYRVGNAYHINSEKSKEILVDMLKNKLEAYDLSKALRIAADGTLYLALAGTYLHKVSKEEIASIRALIVEINNLGDAATKSGGGGSQKSAIQNEYDLRIKNAEKEKAALKQRLEDYKKIIDARKAILKSMKDEVDYQDTLKDKSHNVAKLQNELLAISLDNSEEAKAKRLRLEEDLANAKEDLDKTQRDRAYELQIEALDKEYKAYENMINAQMDLLDNFIQSLKDALEEIIGNKGRTGAGTGSGSTASTSYAIHAPTPQEAAAAAAIWNNYHGGAEGGVVTGGIPGKDSVNAMLMPGEFVLKRNIVNSLGVSVLDKLNRGSSIQNTLGGISMPITVMGNLDRTVLPDIEKIVNKAFEKMNSTMLKRGYKRAVNQYSS